MPSTRRHGRNGQVYLGATNGAVAVQGNHDLSVLRDRNSNMNLEALEVIEWTRTQLTPVQRNFLAELPLTMERDHLMFVHASAHEPASWEYVRSAEQAERSLKATACRMVFSGHVHRPALYRRADDGHMGGHAPVAGKRIPLAPQHQYLVIPGSCGQPRDGNPSACYALYDDTAREITYHRVPYDVNGATRRVIEAGLPIVFAMRLVEGI